MPKPPSNAKGRRPAKAAKTPAPATHGPLLDQRQLDMLGLALIAFGVLIAIPLVRVGAGGLFGDAVADGAQLLLGGAAYGAPLLAIGAGLVAVSPIGARASLRIGVGGLTAFSAFTLLARAAAGPDTHARWEGAHLRDAGGMLGEGLWALCHGAFGSLGPYVIAIVLILGAALLLTGAELAAVAGGAGRGIRRAIAVPLERRAQRRADVVLAPGDDVAPAVAEATAHAQAQRGDLTSASQSGTGTGRQRRLPLDEATGTAAAAAVPGADAPRTWTSAADDARSGLTPPEFPGSAPVVVRARKPALIDGAERFPDLYGGDGPVWIGPVDEEHEQDITPVRPREPFPDPLEEFDAELTAARQADGTEDLREEDPEDAGVGAPAALGDADDFGESELTPLPQDDDHGHESDEHDDGADLDADGRDAIPAGAPDGPKALTPMGRYRAEVTEAPDFPWKVPPRRLLARSPKVKTGPTRADQQQTATALVEALGHFGVQAELVGCVAGPHITRYELRLAPGVKMSKVGNLKDDLAYSLAATDIRILAPIPGKTAVGVEVPNSNRALVRLGDVWADAPPKHSPLTVWLGKDVEGESIVVDLAKMPHLLVAGTTGAGKSACINGMLSSILLGATPHDVRMVLVDPKQVELTPYESIPHLLTPVITSPKMAATALQNLVREMEARYSTMSLSRTRSLPELNRVRRERGEQEFPYILCVIDELADLMMVAPGEVEDSIIRLAQKARAVGIHLVLATQSPRVDVITGMIKANVPSRIAFAVSSQTDSRVILDQNGAESLLGQGDMLFSPVGSAKLHRIQGAYIDEPQIEAITGYWRKQGEPEFREELLEAVEEEPAAEDTAGGGLDPDEDPMLEEAIRLVVEMGTASTSMMQRRLRVGYTRAGRLVDMLERRGVISGYEGSKARQVLIGAGDVERLVASIKQRSEAQTPTLFTGEAPPAAEARDPLTGADQGAAAGDPVSGEG